RPGRARDQRAVPARRAGRGRRGGLTRGRRGAPAPPARSAAERLALGVGADEIPHPAPRVGRGIGELAELPVEEAVGGARVHRLGGGDGGRGPGPGGARGGRPREGLRGPRRTGTARGTGRGGPRGWASADPASA